MERYIAIDNVCAWPCVTAAPDGTLLATLFNQPVHGACEGDTECWASEDEGRSWRRRGVVHPHEPGTNNGLNHAAGFGSDGDFVVIAMGRDNRPPAGQIRSATESRILPPVVCRSSDLGHTWRSEGSVEADPSWAHPPIPFGPLVHMDAETLAVPMHAGDGVYLYVSRDRGRAWSIASRVCSGDHNETCLLRTRDGRLLLASRTYGDQHLDLFISGDSGKTWETRGPLTLAGQIPGNLLQLRDGRILLTFGIRNPGLRGIGYRWSLDGGESWSRPGLLLDFGMITDGGYPSSVELADSTIVTAYYAGAVPAHLRYHMGVMRWRPEELKDPGAFEQSYAGGKLWSAHWGGARSFDPGHAL